MVIDERADNCNLLQFSICRSLLSVAKSEFAGMDYLRTLAASHLGKHCCPRLEEVLTLAEVTRLTYWKLDILQTAQEHDSQSDKQEDVAQIDHLA